MTLLARPILISVLWLAAIPLEAGLDTQTQEPASCVVIQHALTDYARIKSGVTRREVEKYFTQDGGLQFQNGTRYVYSECRYLHVDVEFSSKPSADRLFAPDDVVTKASRLYVDYSAKD